MNSNEQGMNEEHTKFSWDESNGPKPESSAGKEEGLEQTLSKEKPGVQVRYGVVGSGRFEIITDNNRGGFQGKMREATTGSENTVTLKNEADTQKWLSLMNQALELRNKYGVQGPDGATIRRLEKEIKELEVE